jgi:hypothetical protein
MLPSRPLRLGTRPVNSSASRLPSLSKLLCQGAGGIPRGVLSPPDFGVGFAQPSASAATRGMCGPLDAIPSSVHDDGPRRTVGATAGCTPPSGCGRSSPGSVGERPVHEGIAESTVEALSGARASQAPRVRASRTVVAPPRLPSALRGPPFARSCRRSAMRPGRKWPARGVVRPPSTPAWLDPVGGGSCSVTTYSRPRLTPSGARRPRRRSPVLPAGTRLAVSQGNSADWMKWRWAESASRSC